MSSILDPTQPLSAISHANTLGLSAITSRRSTGGESGSRLHYQAKIIEENKKLLKAKINREKLEKEMSEVTFKPKVFTKPKMQQIRDPNARAEDYLYLKQEEKKHNLERLKQEKEDRLMEECNNFQPKINSNSAMIDRIKMQTNINVQQKQQFDETNISDDSNEP